MPTDSLTQSLAQSLLGELLRVSNGLGRLEEHGQHTSHRLDRLELQQSELSFEMRNLRSYMRSPPMAPAPTSPSRPQKDTAMRTVTSPRGRRYFRKALSWLAEKLLGLVFPYLLPIVLSSWALIHSYGAALMRWLMMLSAML